jgi:signal transduction histidine kinase
MIRSAAYRIAALSSLAYAAATLALGGAVYYAAHQGLRQQFDDRIALETGALVDGYRREGVAELRDLIARRDASGGASDLRYALYATDGRRLAGNYLGARPDPGLRTLSIRSVDGDEDQERVLATPLDHGERLVVAADWDALEDNDQLILSLLGAACLAVAAIGVIGAWLLGAYLRRRLSAISFGAEAIMAGELDQRIAISPRGDEFDRLSGVLNAMLDRIGALLDNLRQVSSEIAHDLRTPLTHLRNQLEAGMQGDDAAETLERAIAQADELLALFSAILRLSEIESGQLAALFTPVDLTAVVTDIGESYAPAIEDRRRGFVCEIDSIAPILGDRELLAQAVVNLLDNAQTHTPEWSEIRLSLNEQAGVVRLTVADDGPGVPLRDQTRITQRFVRLEASRTRPGHGLGLSLVAAIARVHRARLRIADNEPGLSVTIEFMR